MERLQQAHEQEAGDESRTSTEPRFVHDFSRIPVRAGARTAFQPKLEVNTPGPGPETATPSTTIKLSGGVGARGPNQVGDLKAIQAKLLAMGYLSTVDQAAEGDTLLKSLKATDKVEAGKIPKTIAAIKEYERVVLYKTGGKYDKPTGQISPGGDSLALMNAQIATPSATELAGIIASRAALSAPVVVGGELALKGKVGKVAEGNEEAELNAVQQRLVGLGKLSSKDLALEVPTVIRAKHPDLYKGGKTSIDQKHIPKTIKAIQDFQTEGQFRHSFWKTKTFAGKDLSSLSWENGVVSKGDLSEFILSHYQKVTYGFKDESGKDKSLTAGNFEKTGVTRDAAGRSVVGTADAASFTVDEFKAYGISEVEAKALLFVSRNEGKFNAVNTYDRAAISFGFVQFAGGSGGGTFPKMMATLKQDSPAVFKDKFGKYGIDVEFAEQDGNVTSATVVAIDPVTGKVLRGQDAEQYIRNLPGLLGPFLGAGHDKAVQQAQVKTAVKEYVIPSRGSKFSADASASVLKYKQSGKDIVSVGAEAVAVSKSAEYAALPVGDRGALKVFSLAGEKISDYLTSEKARAVIIDQSINMGPPGGAIAISKGMGTYILGKKEISKDNLKSASEADILASIQPFAFVPARVKKAIDDTSLSAT